MSAGQKVEIAPEDIAGHDGTIESAKGVWTQRRGRINFNQWQSLYYGLRRMGLPERDVPTDEYDSPQKRGQRIKLAYVEVQGDIPLPGSRGIEAAPQRRLDIPALEDAGAAESSATQNTGARMLPVMEEVPGEADADASF